MDEITRLDKFRVPVGNQEIELLQVRFAAGGVPLLRLRIREHRRFTIFDIDAVTAARWASAMGNWAQGQLAADASSDGGAAKQGCCIAGPPQPKGEGGCSDKAASY